jgi:hypothetical protein
MNRWLKRVVLVLITLGLSACESVSNVNTGYSDSREASFTDALGNQPWLKQEYVEYQFRWGFKAFAIAVDSTELVIATGFSDDQVSQQAAYDEAMRLCQYFSEGDGQCWVADEQESGGYLGLTQAQIDAAPAALTTHRDILEYIHYKKAQAHKAFVVASGSGEAFWLGHQESKLQAEEKALQQCELNRHESDPWCTLLKSI